MLKSIMALQLLVTTIFSSHAIASQSSFVERYNFVKEQIDFRWNTFQTGRQFVLFLPGRTEADLQDEYDALVATRRQIWRQPDYSLARNLIEADLVRYPGCLAFAYNNTVPTYNASTLYLNKRFYIACEGPRSKDVPSFFNLMISQGITHLIRLTDAFEGKTKKCHPYWNGLLERAPDGKVFLQVPDDEGFYPVRAFTISNWFDNQGFDAKQLLETVLQVKEELNASKGFLLVHCSAGVGRTGTFLAALAITDVIDANQSLSIQEIVYRLSLQRVRTVSRFEQYQTLHQLAELYLNRNRVS